MNDNIKPRMEDGIPICDSDCPPEIGYYQCAVAQDECPAYYRSALADERKKRIALNKGLNQILNLFPESKAKLGLSGAPASCHREEDWMDEHVQAVVAEVEDNVSDAQAEIERLKQEALNDASSIGAYQGRGDGWKHRAEEAEASPAKVPLIKEMAGEELNRVLDVCAKMAEEILDRRHKMRDLDPRWYISQDIAEEYGVGVACDPDRLGRTEDSPDLIDTLLATPSTKKESE